MSNNKQTIAQQLNIAKFPYVVKDDKGNEIYITIFEKKIV